MIHTQMKESSLTSPSDRDKNYKWLPEQHYPPLDIEETKNASDELSDTHFIRKFPKVDRTYADPAIPMQTYGLISFIPSKGAKPDEKGIYGFAKLRGNYHTLIESQQRAEFLIRNVDSYHQIYHSYVGRPFPLTVSSSYTEETDEIDIRKDVTKTVSESIKDKKLKEKQEIEEIKEKEKEIMKHNTSVNDGTYEEDPYEKYIVNCVKKAQLTWSFFEHLSKMHDIRDIILKTKKEIETVDEQYPEFKDKYLDKYIEARKEAGLDVESDLKSEQSFMKYMVTDRKIPTIDTDENLPVYEKED
jgi:hypothetical protein